MAGSTNEKGLIGVRDITLCGICLALLIICSYISVPTAIPFTLQTFAIFLSIYLLGWWKSLIVIASYLIMGALGLPVFSRFQGGFAVILGPTGGFLLGFLLLPMVYLPFESIKTKQSFWFVLSMVIGLIVLYACGTLWMGLVASSGTEPDWGNILLVAVVPFLLPDAIKLTLAALSGRLIRKVLSKRAQ